MSKAVLYTENKEKMPYQEVPNFLVKTIKLNPHLKKEIILAKKRKFNAEGIPYTPVNYKSNLLCNIHNNFDKICSGHKLFMSETALSKLLPYKVVFETDKNYLKEINKYGELINITKKMCLIQTHKKRKRWMIQLNMLMVYIF